MANARFCDASLVGAEFRNADAKGADFSRAIVDDAAFHDTDLRGVRLKGVRGFENATFIGADVRDADFCGAYLVRRHILDENYLHEFKTRDRAHEIIYWIWWTTSDCGRSFLRWGAFTSLVCVMFAMIFPFVDINHGNHPTPFSNFYFSVVVLTTLGFGDVLPASMGAQIVVVAEVIIGYMLVGGLLGIFAAKMGRRAD